MNDRWLSRMLCAEGALCLMLFFTLFALGTGTEDPAAFPLGPTAALLRALSLSGAVGNGVAVTLFLLTGFAPLAGLLFLRRAGRLLPVDGLLALLSPLLLGALYCAINPGLLAEWSGNPMLADGSVTAALLGGLALSVLMVWLALRWLPVLLRAEAPSLRRWLGTLLRLVMALLVFAICGPCFGALLQSVADLQTANTGCGAGELLPSYLLLGAQYLVTALPYALELVVIQRGLLLLNALDREPYGAASVRAANDLAHWCSRALSVTLLASLGLYCLQILLSGVIRSISVVVQLPAGSLLLVLGAMLVARYIASAKALKDESDLFI